ncbi:hypothetical protein EG343_09570 [Chryseobacterium nakagawai]|uniref:Uncharacterized protein n=1 Tax=Chryseobacterium nakagawai TaxID=1241982 RepID=A0AAD1DQX7_CHRNA|nr:hypothetical protein EG343_09570 [Chryseobacterium nakagawai]
MRGLLFEKRVQVPEIICENLPLYGVVVVVVNVETVDTPEIGDFRIEISDMFLEKFIITKQMYKLFWNGKVLT